MKKVVIALVLLAPILFVSYVLMNKGSRVDKSSIPYVQIIDISPSGLPGHYNHLEWHPSGEKVYFHYNDGGDQNDIGETTFDQKEHRLLTKCHTVCGSYSQNLSPQGNYYVFSDYGRRDIPLSIIKLKTGEIRTIFHVEGNFLWSINELLAINLSTGGLGFWVYTPDTGAKVKIEKNKVHGFAWSVDGKKLIYSVRENVYVVNSDGKAKARVGEGSYHWLSWAPHSKFVVGQKYNSDKLWLINLDTNSESVLCDLLADNNISWSPDGKSLLYTRKSGEWSAPLHGGDVLPTDVWRVFCNTGQMKQLTSDNQSGGAEFCANGKHILCLSPYAIVTAATVFQYPATKLWRLLTKDEKVYFGEVRPNRTFVWPIEDLSIFVTSWRNINTQELHIKEIRK